MDLRPLPIRALAEFLGTGILVTAVVGSGIAAERFSPGDLGMQVQSNSMATALVLVALIFTLGPLSGAHLNPAVTLAERVSGKITNFTAGVYIACQVVGGCLGTIAANLMYELPAVDWSSSDRTSFAHALAEVIATAGLLVVITGVVHSGRLGAVPIAVASYIGSAVWFTSSTSFANPAVTIARTFTETLTGIAPASVPIFVLAQLGGMAVGIGLSRALFPETSPSLREVANATR